MSIPARSMKMGTTLSAACAFALAVGVLPPVGATTQAAVAQSIDQLSPADLLEEFIHYTRVAKPGLAAGYGEALLNRGITNAELAAIVDDGGLDLDRLDAALERALRVPELEKIAAELNLRIETGRHDLAREQDRIDAAINMLTGHQRQRMLGRARLAAAGEYAVPALLRAVVESNDEKLRLECMRLLESDEIGRMAVTPLCVALGELDSSNQVTICRLLGGIGYGHAGPTLRAIAADDTAAQTVRDAAMDAFNRVAGGDDSVSDLFAQLARSYFDDLGSLVAYPFESTNNVWSYDAFIGLVATPAPTSIFNEIMAMGAAGRALELDADNRDALMLYVAANLKRENDLTGAEADPIYGGSDRSPAFYATVFGTSVCQDVLGLAIDSTDTALVRDAIAALSQTTGGSNLLTSGGSRIPLVESLSYPDRRVQYEAALTLGRALPATGFSGDHRVVPILASAVRTGNETFALVVADDEENLQVERERLKGMGFTVLAAEPTVELTRDAVSQAMAIDVIAVRMSSPEGATQAVASIRGMGRTAATPVVIVAAAVDEMGLNREYRGSSSIAVTRTVSEEAYGNVITALLTRAAGGRLTDAEADEYAILSLEALRDVAIAKSPAFDISDAEGALLDALGQRSGSLRLMIADILAHVDSDRAQQALFDAALAASGREQEALLDATTASVRTFGDRADRRHVLNLVDLVEKSAGSVAEAAARLHGALNLQTSDAIRLITSG